MSNWPVQESTWQDGSRAPISSVTLIGDDECCGGLTDLKHGDEQTVDGLPKASAGVPGLAKAGDGLQGLCSAGASRDGLTATMGVGGLSLAGLRARGDTGKPVSEQ